MRKNYMDTNKEGWDLRTDVHVDSEFYDIKGFLNGKITLNKPELELLKDVKGKKFLHLQCHFGLDTLSWARLGAIPTGVDFSPKAIETARKINKLTNLNVNFIEGDVQNLDTCIKKETFDLGYSSYGVLCWIQRLDKWAQGIKNMLKPGGKFTLIEFHPILDVLFDGKVSGHKDYFGSGPLGALTKGTYTNNEAPIEYFEYRWQHPISEVINALLSVGLKISSFEEYPFSPYNIFPGLSFKDDGSWYSSKQKNDIPYLYAIVVTK